METKISASDMKKCVGKVELHDISEKIDCLNNCPPRALQLQLILSQGCLSAYDVYSVSLVSHYFRELFFSYALKPDHLKNLPFKQGNWKAYSSHGHPRFQGTQVSKLIDEPDKLWTPQEKFKQFPVECVKDEFLPFSLMSLEVLKSLSLGSILIKHHLAIKKCTFSYLLENYRIVKKQLKSSGIYYPLNESMRDYILVGLLKNVEEVNSLTKSEWSCLNLKCIQQRLVDGKISMQEAVKAVESDDVGIWMTLNEWNDSSSFQKQLTFEQVLQYPRQASFFMKNWFIREFIFKEEQENVENGQKIKSDFLKLNPDSLEMYFLRLSVFEITKATGYNELVKFLSTIEKLLQIHEQKNKSDRNVSDISVHSKSIWTDKLTPIADMINVEKLFKLGELRHLCPEKIMILAEEPVRSALKSGALSFLDIMGLSVDGIMEKLDPHPEKSTVQQ